jgi:hypothetical protein
MQFTRRNPNGGWTPTIAIALCLLSLNVSYTPCLACGSLLSWIQSRIEMRQVSKKQAALLKEASGYRRELVAKTGKCMVCGASPKNPTHGLAELNELCCHEILNGAYRSMVLTEPSCLIVACWYCNQYELDAKGDWPLERQLAIIKAKAPERYDLQRVLTIRNPNAMRFVTEDEVDAWTDRNEAYLHT